MSIKLDLDKMNAASLEIAQEIHERFGFDPKDCGKWSKFIVMSAEIVKYAGLEYAEKAFQMCAEEYLK